MPPPLEPVAVLSDLDLEDAELRPSESAVALPLEFAEPEGEYDSVVLSEGGEDATGEDESEDAVVVPVEEEEGDSLSRTLSPITDSPSSLRSPPSPRISRPSLPSAGNHIANKNRLSVICS